MVALALCLAGIAAAQPPAFSLDDAMAAHATRALRSDALTPLPGGRHLAWIDNGQVYVASAPQWLPRKLTLPASALAPVALHPSTDGHSLIVASGDVLATFAEYPRRDRRQWWLLDISNGSARLLLEADAVPQGAPVFAPDGRSFAVADGRMLHRYLLTDARLTPQPLLLQDPQHMPSIGVGQLAWSPDGARLAFVSRRKAGQSYIGIVDVDTRAYRYLDPGIFRDLAPAWSPDGSQLAFLRWPYHEALDLPARAGVPFSLRVADPRSGSGHEAWRAPAGRAAGLSSKLFWGSQFFEGDVLFWGAGDRLVFPWEGDGWLHLYSVAASGGAATLLTPGDYEVSTVRLSGDRRDVVFAANRDDPDRQHLWRVPVAGGAMTAITRGQGIESSPVPLGQGSDAVAYLASDAQRQVHPVVPDAGRPRALQASRATTAAPATPATLIEPQAVTLTAADGQRFQGQLLLPPASVAVPAGGRPALLFLHGGPPDRMMLGFHYWTYYSHTQAFNQAMAQQGYVVLSINYRRGSGYGLDFREALEGGLNGASEFADVLAAGKWLAARKDVDARRVGLWGGSYGGYLTAMGLARAPEVFAAGVDLHGVHDWSTREYDEFTGGHDADGVAAEAVRRAFASSPLADVSRWRAPVLFVHGDDDLNVRFDQSVRLVDALRKRGLSPDVLVFPNEPHQFLLHRSWRRTLHAAMAFFERHLGSTGNVTAAASTAAAGTAPASTTAASPPVLSATSSLPVRQDSQ